MSKGSKSRVTDKKRFERNFDAIEWDSIEVQTEHGPGIVVEPSCPTDKAFIFSPRKPDETDAEWAKRCCVIKNIGKSE